MKAPKAEGPALVELVPVDNGRLQRYRRGAKLLIAFVVGYTIMQSISLALEE